MTFLMSRTKFEDLAEHLDICRNFARGTKKISFLHPFMDKVFSQLPFLLLKVL